MRLLQAPMLKDFCNLLYMEEHPNIKFGGGHLQKGGYLIQYKYLYVDAVGLGLAKYQR